jgi:methionyl-tRNA formyltransferase
MTLSILSSDGHPVVPWLHRWQREMEARGHSVTLCFHKDELPGGDVLFLVSCAHIIRAPDRQKYGAVLVLHASDLPRGRGWSPHIWTIVNGGREVTVCLLEAADKLDTGDVWMRVTFRLDGHELLPDINKKLFAAEVDLMTRAVEGRDAITPSPQVGEAGPYLRKRTADDSRLDPHRTLAEQFDLLRVVDNDRYPAFMEYRGTRYLFRIETAPPSNTDGQ